MGLSARLSISMSRFSRFLHQVGCSFFSFSCLGLLNIPETCSPDAKITGLIHETSLQHIMVSCVPFLSGKGYGMDEKGLPDDWDALF